MNLHAKKEAAARAAVARVQNGMSVGLGSGTTAELAIRFLGDRVRAENLQIIGVPTSPASRSIAAAAEIPLLASVDSFQLDIAIDGADEVTLSGDAIKGGGAALLHERIVAAAADEFILICDSSKVVERLGAFPLPVEVVPFGWQNIAQRLRDFGCEPKLRHDKSEQPLRTAEGNLILDCHFASLGIPDPRALDRRLRDVPGVVDHGLFLGMAKRIFVGRRNRVDEIEL